MSEGDAADPSALRSAVEFYQIFKILQKRMPVRKVKFTILNRL